MPDPVKPDPRKDEDLDQPKPVTDPETGDPIEDQVTS